MFIISDLSESGDAVTGGSGGSSGGFGCGGFSGSTWSWSGAMSSGGNSVSRGHESLDIASGDVLDNTDIHHLQNDIIKIGMNLNVHTCSSTCFFTLKAKVT